MKEKFKEGDFLTGKESVYHGEIEGFVEKVDGQIFVRDIMTEDLVHIKFITNIKIVKLTKLKEEK